MSRTNATVHRRHVTVVAASFCSYDGGVAAPQTTPVQVPDVETVPAADRPWITVVHDDPVNLMTYVTYVFQKLFGYSEPQATKLMLQVHNEGKAVVSSGAREKIEADVARLHAHGLWATMQQDR